MLFSTEELVEAVTAGQGRRSDGGRAGIQRSVRLEQKGGRPMLCVTGLEKTPRALALRLAGHARFAMQEVRLDALPRNPPADVLHSVDPRTILVSCRRTKDFGLFKGPEETRLKRLEKACTLGIGWIDLEADLPETAYHRIRAATRGSATRVLRSLHLGEGATCHEIQGAFSLLARSPGDAIKLFVPVQDAADLAPLLRAPRERPAVLVAGGNAGVLSRALYSRFAGAWTYIAANPSTAPIPGMLDVRSADLLGMPLDRKTAFYVLLGGPSIASSPGFRVYNRLFRERGFNAVYLPAITTKLDETFDLLTALGLAGASVTIPHKVGAARLPAHLDDPARQTRVVNTLYRREGVWRGANTDVEAVTVVAERLGGRSGQRALILGTGGFARAGAWALADLGIRVTLLGRSVIEEPGPWEDCLPLAALEDLPFHILMNATPLKDSRGCNGLLPKNIDLQGKIVIDGMLGPHLSPLVRLALSAKSRVAAGIDVWAEQGARQMALFRCPPVTPADLRRMAIECGMAPSAAVSSGQSARQRPRSSP